MKLIVFLLLSTLAFAGTVYRTPVFTVEHSTLYCWKEIDLMIIVEHKPGDLLDGAHVLSYCSYNLDTTKEKYNTYVNSKKEAPTIIGFILVAAISLFTWIIFMP